MELSLRMPVNKILVISRNWIGDAIGNTVAIRNIRLCFPQSHIVVLTSSRCLEVFRVNPDVDEVIIWKSGHGKLWWSHFRWFLRLREKRFDTIFLFHESRSRAVMSWFLGARNRIGYNTKKRAALLSVDIQEPVRKMHFVDRYCELIQNVGVSIQHQRYVWGFSVQSRSWLQNFLFHNGLDLDARYIVIHPAANREHRLWGCRDFARLADRCKKELDLNIIFSGRDGDRGIIDQITSFMKEPFISSVGVTTLEYLAVLIKGARVYVGVDTGATHLAAATSTPVIALFGATFPHRVGPYHLNDGAIIQKEIHCRKDQCDLSCHEVPKYRCIREISVDEVMDRIKKGSGLDM